MIKCCIFDLDGTLLYTLKTITYYLNRALSANGAPEITEDQCRVFIGNGARTLVKRALKAGGIEDAELAHKVWFEYNRDYNKDTLYLTEAYDGIPELIEELKERGVTLAVLSNKPDDTTGAIIAEKFGGYFNIARGGRDDIPLKPAPDGLVKLMDELGVLPSEVMYLGDTGVDIITGKTAGVKITAGVAWGYHPPAELLAEGADIIVNTPRDVLLQI